MATRVRVVVPGAGYRLYEERKPKNRHRVDVRQTDVLPAFRTIEGVRVVAPEERLSLWCEVVQEPNIDDDEDDTW